MNSLSERFAEMVRRVGGEPLVLEGLDEAVSRIAELAGGLTLVPKTTLSERHGLADRLVAAGLEVAVEDFRRVGPMPAAGVTFCNFALADTGTVVLDSTAEAIRLATTLPERHFVLADPATILADNLAAVEPMTALHQGSAARFIAYVTGPSRTADIERVLTIGCHGPRELYVLLVAGLSDDPMEI
jgi:L-lactate dehydrogenase complex protein LldG